MSQDVRSCPSCGAQVSPDAAVCDLCGTPVGDDPEEPAEDPVPNNSPDVDSEGESSSIGEAEQASVYCHECGWENPPGANYCSQCGTELQDLSRASSPEGTRPVTADLPGGPEPTDDEGGSPESDDDQAEMGQRILAVVGTGVLLVLGLFFVTQWSQQYEWGASSGSEPPGEQQTAEGQAVSPSSPAGPSGRSGASSSPQAAAASAPADLSTLVDELGGSVQGSVADQIDSVRTALEEADNEQRRALQRQLADLYVGAGTPGRAALVQSGIADQTGRTEDRRRVANLLYKWMRQVQQAEGRRAEVADVAQHVAQAYAAVVKERPEDLDARTRMGEAYLLTNNPMKGIEAINQVLEDDSTFVPARFQKGLALLQINRLDQAVTQFESVMEFASQDDPFYEQAKRAIKVIREEGQSSSQESSAGS
ncbi:MAG: zinc ribbon domain-containing protein [Bacteroidetes bacterium QH_7_62_13]|nr:MAG: zinc ribbon domain-containing protein [Bacteroidetes bacterium QH_7_62_13]